MKISLGLPHCLSSIICGIEKWIKANKSNQRIKIWHSILCIYKLENLNDDELDHELDLKISGRKMKF